jgi:hypothetical protein
MDIPETAFSPPLLAPPSGLAGASVVVVAAGFSACAAAFLPAA